MSLLFDALKRAQDSDAKPGSPQGQPSDRRDESKAGVKPAHAGVNRIWPYSAAGLVLIAAISAWIYFLNDRHKNIAPQPEALPKMAEIPAPPPAASQVTAASSVAKTVTAASTTAPPVAKPWTHPAAHKRRSPARLARRAIPAAPDPLKTAYQALSEGRLDQAEQSYTAELAQHPHEKDALLGLAVIAQRKQQTARAADLYHQVLHEDMGNASAAAGLVSLSEQTDPVAAESQLKELIDIKPGAPELHYALGCVLARQLRWGEAQQAFFRAYSLAPDKALYAYNLAVSLDRIHQQDAALPYYEKASQLAKGSTLDLAAIERRIQELKTPDSR